jgi:hypothetical protein
VTPWDPISMCWCRWCEEGWGQGQWCRIDNENQARKYAPRRERRISTGKTKRHTQDRFEMSSRARDQQWRAKCSLGACENRMGQK